MSMQRTIARNMARERLADSGYERPNRRMSVTSQGGAKKRQLDEQSHRGRKNSRRRKAFLSAMRHLDPPVWRRVLDGDISGKFENYQKKIWLKRELAIQAKRVHRKGLCRLQPQKAR